jgi:hypothetical protein
MISREGPDMKRVFVDGVEWCPFQWVLDREGSVRFRYFAPAADVEAVLRGRSGNENAPARPPVEGGTDGGGKYARK